MTVVRRSQLTMTQVFSKVVKVARPPATAYTMAAQINCATLYRLNVRFLKEQLNEDYIWNFVITGLRLYITH
jgi:hypothetical protein